MKDYRKRIADALLAEKLSYMGAVLVQGAKWCGKTTTAEQIAGSVFYMGDFEHHEENVTLARVNPKAVLNGTAPHLIDEWQEVPSLWDSVRFAIDHGEGVGRFILTGSAVPPAVDVNEKAGRREIMHTGTGRIARLTMRPMTLWESGDAEGSVSFADLFAGKDVAGAKSNQDFERVAELVCRGGWPGAIGLKGRAARGPAKEYLTAICESDVSRVDSTLRDPGRVRRLLRSLGRLQGTQASASVITADMIASDSEGLTENTIYSYLKALKRIFVVEDLEAWCPNLRCKTPLRTAETRYFTDPSIAAAALGIGPGDLVSDVKTFGLLFETLALRDLRTYAEELDGRVSHYLDKNGLECDAVMHLDNGAYGLIEVKLGGDALVAKGVSSLVALAAKIDTSKMRSPSFKMVLTAHGDFAYPYRDTGVLVCPIGCLRGSGRE